MMNRRLSWVALLGLLACSGSITSVPSGTSTTSLSPTQATQLCNDVYSYEQNNLTGKDIAELSCNNVDESMSDAAACEQAYTQCVAAAGPNGTPLPSTPNCTTFQTAVAACNTTVGEYTKCLQQEIQGLKSEMGDYPTCTPASQQAASSTFNLSLDCVSLLVTCGPALVPGLYGASDAGDD